MAGLSFSIRPSSLTSSPATVSIFHGMRCCCSRIPPDHAGANKHGTAGGETPQLLKIAVSGVTELLRILSPLSRAKRASSRSMKSQFLASMTSCRSSNRTMKRLILLLGSSLLEFMLKTVYLKIRLLDFEGEDAEEKFILATWKLRSYLRLPWRPLISIDGRTVYELDNNFEIVRHAESWNVSSLQAIGQIFTPNFGRSNHD
ncbi:uncharacterized protein LOC116212912 isoform X4 [Punica granatum]|uniref:Uncharacterized protein LOC116212912 isoform X4 n=1 Tax=Punica granatum TaxID=22663 RepID=A0A6P8E8A2_PUNGR|nr:uncharacterized protein LOC116212912 isoform X4 [Punica granatum]